MPFPRERPPLWRRAANTCLSGLRFAVRSIFVLVMIVLPIPLLPVQPKMGRSERKDETGQLKPKE